MHVPSLTRGSSAIRISTPLGRRITKERLDQREEVVGRVVFVWDGWS
jgi:hypothetical protein